MLPTPSSLIVFMRFNKALPSVHNAICKPLAPNILANDTPTFCIAAVPAKPEHGHSSSGPPFQLKWNKLPIQLERGHTSSFAATTTVNGAAEA